MQRHPLASDPKTMSANALIGRIRTARCSHEWRAIQQDLDACDPQELVSAMAFACELRSREAFNDELKRSYDLALLEVE